MKEIFISYSVIDTAPAETVRNVLEKNSLSCWMAPRDIPGGSNYAKEIPSAIRNCKVFVLILSRNSQQSPWVLKELDSAVNCGKVILPFMLEDFPLNDEFNFLLTGAQRYAAYQKKAAAMETLIGRIRSILEPGQQAEEAEPAPEEMPEPEAQPVMTPEICLDQAVCSACGSSDLTPKPKKMKRQGFAELVTLLLTPLLALAGGLLVLTLCAIFINSLEVITILFFAGLIGGGIYGSYLSSTIVRRRRIRSHIRVTCYRCNTCGKVFRHDEKITF